VYASAIYKQQAQQGWRLLGAQEAIGRREVKESKRED